MTHTVVSRVDSPSQLGVGRDGFCVAVGGGGPSIVFTPLENKHIQQTLIFIDLQEIYDTEDPLDTLDKFVVYIESGRPKLDTFYTLTGEVTSQHAETWMARMRQCWSEAERITSKAWLQLTDEATNKLDALPFSEGHF